MDSLLLIPERSLSALHLRLFFQFAAFFSNFETKIGKNPDILEKKPPKLEKSREIGKNAANWKNPHFITSRAFEIVSIAIETSIAIASWNLYCYCYW